MRHIEVLAPYPEPVVVAMGPRLRCSHEERDIIEYRLSELGPRPLTFRVSGMAVGPEHTLEKAAPLWGHRVEVWSMGAEMTTARRFCKNDDAERDAASLIGAHSLWVWPLTSQLLPDSRLLDYEMITIAQELGVPVFLFLPEANDFEIVGPL